MKCRSVLARDMQAQSLVELCLLGIIIITLLGTMLTYGLRNTFQQQTGQRAFRKAMARAIATPATGEPMYGGATYVLIDDRHIPNPSDSFAKGSVQAFSASPTVLRDYMMEQTPDPADGTIGLPRITFNVGGQEKEYFTAGFSNFTLSSECSFLPRKKYEIIYGAAHVWGVRPDEPTTPYVITVLDFCDGQIMSYDSCKDQCRMFTDAGYCTKECIDDGGTNCAGACSIQVELPWYCQTVNGAFKLDTLFSFAVAVDHSHPKAMGVQSDSKRQDEIGDSMAKRENSQRVVSMDQFSEKTTTYRRIIFRPMYDTSGGYSVDNIATEKVHQERLPLSSDWDSSRWK